MKRCKDSINNLINREMGGNVAHQVAAGELKLIPVHDGLGASITPASCVVKANFDGSNPDLSQANTEISLLQGGMRIAFDFSITEVSDKLIEYDVLIVDRYTVKLSITNIPTTILSGCVKFKLITEYGSTINGEFSISVVRESTMLDWIQDWENNKTQIGSTYLISPKIFVGTRVSSEEDELGQLTGVYIGPDTNKTAGLYGYKEGKEIFYINGLGGSIGGWQINDKGIQTSDGTFQILSGGSIFSKNSKKEVLWGIYKSGEARFAKGNVAFHQDGSAEFKGKITSEEGAIAGWNIKDQLLYSSSVVLDSANNYIGIGPVDLDALNGTDHKSTVSKNGGVYLHYTSDESYGIAGYIPMETVNDTSLIRQTFSLGSSNFIAGWNFDHDSLWMGDKTNAKSQYTPDTNSITIGTEGLRGNGWYIDVDGKISFMKGLVSFDKTGGNMVGWKLTKQRLSTNKTALISEDAYTGLYLSVTDISNISTVSLSDEIQKKGGLYIRTNSNDTILGAYKQNGSTSFYLSAVETNIIAGWSFNENAIFSGTEISNGFTEKDGDITIGSSGIRGFKWRFEADGSGSLAGDNISWNKDGVLTFSDSVQLKWSQITGVTTINKDGIYTGAIDAKQIITGTIDATKIEADVILSNGDAWGLNKDGSGFLANKNIAWKKDGNLKIKANIAYPYFVQHISSEGDIVDLSSSYNIFLKYDKINTVCKVKLPKPDLFPDIEVSIFSPWITTRSSPLYYVLCNDNDDGTDNSFYYAGFNPFVKKYDKINVTGIELRLKSVIRDFGSGYIWYVCNAKEIGFENFVEVGVTDYA